MEVVAGGKFLVGAEQPIKRANSPMDMLFME
jgi:hypothetical protein